MKIATALLIVGLAAAPAAAQTPMRLTLDEAVRRGLETSHRLAAVTADSDAAGASVAVSRAARRPLVTAQAGAMRKNHIDPLSLTLPDNQTQVIYPDIPDTYRARIDVEWAIYTGGRLNAIERAASLEALATRDDRAAAESDLRLEITRAYWNYVTAIESLHVVEQSEQRIHGHLEAVRARLDAGVVPRNDVLSVESQESRQRMLRIRAHASRRVAEVVLARLVGLPPGTSITPASTLDPPTISVGTREELLEQARRQRPDRAALVQRVNAAREQRRAAGALQKPTLSTFTGLEYGRPNPVFFPPSESWKWSLAAGINVSWLVFDGGRAKGETARAAGLTLAAEQRLAELDAALAVDVEQALSELESSRAAIEAGDDSVRSAAEARRVVEDRFRAGVASSTSVLDAHVALLQVELERTQAVAAARLAEAALFRTLGR